MTRGDIQVFDCPQNSPEWHAARMGIATASSFSDILTPAKSKGGEQKTRRTYMLKLAGEILSAGRRALRKKGSPW